MNGNPVTGLARQRRAACTTALAISALTCMGQTVSSTAPYSVVDRGPFYNVLQRTVAVTNSVTGEISLQVQGYTELSDGMNYLSNGVWSTAQDLIEITPTGAQAVHGQMRASFSSDITSVGAISLTTSSEVFQSHPVGLFYFDSSAGKLAQLGSVQASVGTLYPPNVIVFSNVLSGLRADLMLVWAKNGYEQNLVLKQSPPKPESFGLSSSTTTLQFWTAMDSCPVPQEQRPVLLSSGLEDHILFFDSSWLPVGAAFVFGETPLPTAGQAAQVKLMRPTDPGVVPVAKSLVTVSGEQVLVEEVRYTDLAQALGQLPQASLSPKPNQTAKLADRATFLRQSSKAVAAKPMQLASNPYDAKGVVLDYLNLSGNANAYTFTNNSTYHITNSFSVGPGTATFQQNACLKLDTNAYLLVSGNVSCSSSGLPTVLTSSDDNGFGDRISPSSANPGYAAAEDIWMYYQTVQTTLQNLRVRWAQTAIRYDDNGTLTKTPPQLTSSALEDSTTGIYLNIGTGENLGLSQDTYCNVATLINYHGPGGVSGSISENCGVVSVAMVNDPNRDLYDYDTNKNSQSECSFAVLDSTSIVAAFMNTHLSEYGLGDIDATGGNSVFTGIPSPRMTSWATSRNNGTSFSDNGPILPVSTITNGSTVITNGAPDATRGDAGDTQMAYDPNRTTYGTVYLLVNPSRENGFQGFRLWTSTNKGTNFTLINTNVPGSTLITNVDFPKMKLSSTGDLYVSGDILSGSVWAAHSSDGGSTWTSRFLETNNAADTDLVVAPDGTVYVFWLQGSGTAPNNTNIVRYAWLAAGSWSYATNFGITLNGHGSLSLLRFNGDDTNDFFVFNSDPRLAFANGRIYAVYADVPSGSPTTDRCDIFLAEATTNSNHWLGTPTIRKVNNDNTATDQWDPSIAANPAGTELFIRYYSRQNDPTANEWIMAYGAKAYITNGLAQATFDCVPISPTRFMPMFAGTNVSANNWAFDPVWPQNGVCLNINAVYDGSGCDTNGSACGSLSDSCTLDEDIHFCADDYTWAGSDNSYFYFAWCDRSRTNFYSGGNSRPDADVKFAKVKQ